MIEVRELRPDDWKILRDLRLAALTDSPEAFGGNYADSAARDEAGWRAWPADGQPFAAHDDSAAVGLVAAWRGPDRPDTELIAMWVAPPARGTGVAARLVDAVVGWARDNGSAEVVLDVHAANARARRAYAANGFRDVGVSLDHPDRVRMRRAL